MWETDRKAEQRRQVPGLWRRQQRPGVICEPHSGPEIKKRVLMLASVASMIDQFNMPNIRLMQEAGYQVHVACNFEEGNTCDGRRIRELEDALHEMGVHRHQWDCPRKICPAGNWIRAYRQLWRLMGRYHFAWMHCHSPIGGALARAAAHRNGVPVIYTAHGFHFYRGAPVMNWLLYYPAEKLLSYWTDVLVTVNREDYRLARRRLKAGRVCRIPGIGIDTAKFRRPAGKGRPAGTQPQSRQVEPQPQDWQVEPAGLGAAGREFRREYRIPENAVILLSVGELSRRKNHRAVIAARAEIDREDVYYLICGQGPLREELVRQARELGVAGRVILTGFRQDVVIMYHNADIFVFPSLQEGMPAALMEALAAGLPCVVSDIRGNRELVNERGGKKFRVGDAGQLRDGITYFLDRPEERVRCGQHNQKAAAVYDIEAVQCRMKRIYAYMEDIKDKK